MPPSARYTHSIISVKSESREKQKLMQKRVCLTALQIQKASELLVHYQKGSKICCGAEHKRYILVKTVENVARATENKLPIPAIKEIFPTPHLQPEIILQITLAENSAFVNQLSAGAPFAKNTYFSPRR